MQPIYLICGVPGSGKSWICEQLKYKFTYVPHDHYFVGYRMHKMEATRQYLAAIDAAASGPSPVITDSPFAEREMKEKMERLGLTVQPYFVIEPVAVVQARYSNRTGYDLPPSSATRAITIKKRAEEWGAPYGTSTEVLNMLKAL